MMPARIARRWGRKDSVGRPSLHRSLSFRFPPTISQLAKDAQARAEERKSA